MNKSHAQITVAAILATGTVLASGSSAVVMLLLKRDASTPAPACEQLVERIARLAEAHPNVARIYSDPGLAPGLPQLANLGERRQCGNPASLLRHLNSP